MPKLGVALVSFSSVPFSVVYGLDEFVSVSDIGGLLK